MKDWIVICIFLACFSSKAQAQYKAPQLLADSTINMRLDATGRELGRTATSLYLGLAITAISTPFVFLAIKSNDPDNPAKYISYVGWSVGGIMTISGLRHLYHASKYLRGGVGYSIGD